MAICMFVVLLTTTLLQAALGLASNSSIAILPFDAFMKLHARNYNAEELAERRSIYEARLEIAAAHNAKPGQLWHMSVNPLWDWRQAELGRLANWRPGPKHGRRPAHASFLEVAEDVGDDIRPKIPEEVSWAHLAAVKRNADANQGGCGSCWAFATKGALDAGSEAHGWGVKSFSVQELVSCVQNPLDCGGQGGCKGATAELALEYVRRYGLSSNDEIPYTSRDDDCRFGRHGNPLRAYKSADPVGNLQAQDDSMMTETPGGLAVGLKDWKLLPENKAEPLKRALAFDGPTVVSVATDDGWVSYGGGIFDGCTKDVVVGHAVLAIGYGETSEAKYWHIQNSWGNDWGEDGTMRLLRMDDEEQNWCGTDKDPKAGVECKPYRSRVRVCGMCGILYDCVVPLFDKKRGSSRFRGHPARPAEMASDSSRRSW
eukprot:CAMPEP_0117552618 /NCGR_PEP_ID=MMETSP0784-20121206/49800_1 /TAXON_ID=39447 /ORGANISM="" /LENGTH=428 /DNA_ID=CAMNT_0005349695 /DNA_START=28 /DNA_END=1311 /DNA_ORIENTATION=-